MFQEQLQGNTENGPYAENLRKLIQSTKDMNEGGKLSKPSVISNLVLKAVNASRPKTRDVAGAYAKPLMFMRKYLGDRRFDKILMKQFQ